MANPFDQFDAQKAPAPNPFDAFDAPAAAPPAQTTFGGLAKNFAAGAGESLTGAVGMVMDALNPYEQVARVINEGAGHNVVPDASAAPILNKDVLGSVGLNPEDIKAQTPAERAARYAGVGVSSLLLPGGEAGDVSFLSRLAKSVAGGVGGGEVASALPQEWQPLGWLVGSGLGAGAEGAAEKAATGVGRSAGNLARMATGAEMTPEAAETAARSYVGNLMQRAGKTPQSLREAQAAAQSKPIIAAEGLGPSGIAAAATLARRQGETPEVLGSLLRERMEGTGDRALNDFAEGAGIDPRAAQGDIDSLVKAGREKAAPLFDYALSPNQPVWNDELAQLAQRPVIRKAARMAAEDLRNAGREPTMLGIRLDSEGNPLLGPQEGEEGSNLAAVRGTAPTVSQPGSGGVYSRGPTPEAWDLIRKNVGAQVERDPFGKILPDSRSRGNYNINVANRALTGALRDAIPGYGEALDASGDYLSAQKAFNDGQSMIFKSTVPAAKFASHYGSLSAPEQEAFKGGMANALYNEVQKGRLRPQRFAAPILRDKVTAALGPDAAGPFLDKMKIEAQMAKSGARMAPGVGSITSDVLNETSDQDANLRQAAVNGGYALAHLKSGNWMLGSSHLASMFRNLGLIAHDTAMAPAVRNEAGRMLMMAPEELGAYLEGHAAAPAPGRIGRLIQDIKPGLPGAATSLAKVQYSTGGRITAEKNPSAAQIGAGNYRKGHLSLHGLAITVETPKGVARRGISADGKPWENTHPTSHYGYIKKTKGADGEHVDCYVGPHHSSKKVWIIDQCDPRTGRFDEHKVVLGANGPKEALRIYDQGFSDRSGPSRRKHVSVTTVEGFKRWLAHGDTTRPAKEARAA